MARKPGRGLRGRKIGTAKSRRKAAAKGRKWGPITRYAPRGLRGRGISTAKSRKKAAGGKGRKPGRGLRGRGGGG